MKKHSSMRWWQHAILVLGVPVCLMAAFLMGWGELILGVDHTGIATVVLIVEIGLIATSGTIYSARVAETKELTHANFERLCAR
jgi:hypothetical protein